MRYLASVILGLSLCSTVFAADYRGDCRIAFEGDSTLHALHGKASCQPFTVTVSDGVLQFPRVSVPVAGMDTDNKKRDKQMREMFEEKKFPFITGSSGSVSLGEIRAAGKKGRDASAKIALKLKIRDIEKPVTARISNVVETDSQITGDLSFDVSLAEYQLKPPTVLGFIKVDDKVSVTTTVVLTAK